ncbi:MAG: hypothetical protein EOO42_19960 [Flavobacteriales bacterium]|nr:MAG: hypothetical protein EOO42_19960 [Flavobacteriales bacterium]
MKAIILCIIFIYPNFFNSLAASGCLANNGPDGGKKKFTFIIGGNIYSSTGINYNFSYTSSDPCHAEVDAGSTYSPCLIYYGGFTFYNGSIVNHKIVNCPLDFNLLTSAIALFIVGLKAQKIRSGNLSLFA